MSAYKPSRYGATYVSPSRNRLYTSYRPLPSPVTAARRVTMQAGQNPNAPPGYYTTAPATQGTGIPPFGPGAHGPVLPGQEDYPPPFGSNPQSPPSPWPPKTGDGGGGGDGKPPPNQPNPFLDNLIASYRSQMDIAKTNAIAQEKALLMGYGSTELAQKILKAGANDPFVQSVGANPFSDLANIAYQNKFNVQGANEGAGASNLFYGGGRFLNLRNIERGRLGDIYTKGQNAQNAIDLISQNLIARIRELQGNIIAAQAQYAQPSGGG